MKVTKLEDVRTQVAAAGISAFALFCTGCASIVHGTTQKIPVDSSPKGAKVFLDGDYRGETPLVMKVGRSDPGTIRVEMDGFDPKVFPLERSFSWWYVGNVGFGGLIGVVVDAVNGAMWYVEPESILAVFDDAVSSDADLSRVAEMLKNVKRLRDEGRIGEEEFKARVGSILRHGVDSVAESDDNVASESGEDGKKALERKLSYLRDMFKAGAMTSGQIREEVAELDIPADMKTAFLGELGVKLE